MQRSLKNNPGPNVCEEVGTSYAVICMSARGRLPLLVWLQETVRPAWLGTERKDFVAAFYASTFGRPLRARHRLRLTCIRKFVFVLYFCTETHQRKPSCHTLIQA